MKQLIITGPERILEAVENLVLVIWESDNHYEGLNMLKAEMSEIVQPESKERK